LTPPTRSNSDSWIAAEQLHLDLFGDLADLVEEQRAAVGQLEPAGSRRHGAGEGPALVAEELAFDQTGRDRGAVDLDERGGAARRAEVQRAGDELLAGAALAGDEDGRGAGGDGADDLADRLHLRRAADHAGVGARVGELLGGRRGRGDRGARTIAGGDRLLDDLVDLIAVERLLEVVERAELDRLDRRVDAAVGRQQDHGQVRLVDRQRLQQADAVEVRHAQVGDHHVEGPLRRRLDAAESRRAVGLGVDLVALLPQQRPEDLAQVGFVVDEEDAVLGLLVHGSAWGSGAAARAWDSVGRTTVNWAPPPSGELASISPR
jgi:hypothetical protein